MHLTQSSGRDHLYIELICLLARDYCIVTNIREVEETGNRSPNVKINFYLFLPGAVLIHWTAIT